MKKKIIVLIVIIICNVVLFGAVVYEKEKQRERLLKNFSNLEKIYREGRVMALYNGKMGEKIAKETNFSLGGLGVSDYIYAKVKTFKDDRYRKVFHRTTDDGITGEFFIEGLNDKPTFSKWEFDGVPGDLIIIPGNGYIYVRELASLKRHKLSLRNRNRKNGRKYLKFSSDYGVFNRLIKYKVQEEKLVQISKSHYLEGTLNLVASVKMYQSKDMKEVIEVLKKSEKMHLMLQWGDENKYLVRDERNQIGWVNLKVEGRRVYVKWDIDYINGKIYKNESYKKYLKEYRNE